MHRTPPHPSPAAQLSARPTLSLHHSIQAPRVTTIPTAARPLTDCRAMAHSPTELRMIEATLCERPGRPLPRQRAVLPAETPRHAAEAAP